MAYAIGTTYAIGTAVIWISFTDDPEKKEIKQGIVTKRNNSYVWVDNHHKAEDCLNPAFIWLDCTETRKLCEDILTMNARHKAEEDEMFLRQIQLKNKGY